MRVLSLMMGVTTLAASLVFCATASASEESQLIDSINQYRSQLQRCGDQGSQELPPLAVDPRLVLPVNNAGDLQQDLAQAAYPMVNVQAISLSGPRDAQSAMKAVRESFCRVVLDPQFVDIGVSNNGQDWRIVLARPLLSRGLASSQEAGPQLLEMVNAARKRGENTMTEKLAAELLDASNNRGTAVKKREDTHKMADANRAFSHYRW